MGDGEPPTKRTRLEPALTLTERPTGRKPSLGPGSRPVGTPSRGSSVAWGVALVALVSPRRPVALGTPSKPRRPVRPGRQDGVCRPGRCLDTLPDSPLVLGTGEKFRQIPTENRTIYRLHLPQSQAVKMWFHPCLSMVLWGFREKSKNPFSGFEDRERHQVALHLQPRSAARGRTAPCQSQPWTTSSFDQL